MVSYPRRLPSGHITCYLIRTYHVLTTNWNLSLYTPVIVKYRDGKTKRGIEEENWLR